MTKKEYFNELKNYVANNAELTAFIDHELELLAKKNSGKKAPTKTQIENVAIKDLIVASLAPDTKYSVSDIMGSVDACKDLSNQRVSALLTQLIADNKIVRSVEKRKPYFSLV